MSCGAEIEASELMETLLEGVDNIEIPDIDLSLDKYQFPTTDIRVPITRLTNANLTTGTVDGTGTFDVVMKSISNQLKVEYEQGRITGAEYTKAFTALVSSALSSATSFLLQRDQSYWQSQLLQIQAITARVQLETIKADYIKVKLEALTTKANYATAKIALANASNQYCLTKNELETLRPLQAAGLVADNATKVYTNTNLLPVQKDNLLAQGRLLNEQVEVQLAQTADLRTDGTVITGSVGKQKALYSQQITSYQRDAEVKATKLFTDAWITQKTIDEGILPPDAFNNASLQTILEKLKLNNGLT